MTSFVVVTGLLAVWILTASVIGLALGRMVRMRERQHARPASRRVTDLVGTGRKVPSRGDVLRG